MKRNDPIVCLVSSYREGNLIQGTVRSVLQATRRIVVFEGPTEGIEVENADRTDLGSYNHAVLKVLGEWENEHTKRNEMLTYVRSRMKIRDFWILTLDADEILVWGEYLRDWLGQLKPGYPESTENIVPIKRSEAAWIPVPQPPIYAAGFETQIAPSRLIHSSLIECYLVSCWHILTPNGNTGFLDHTNSERMPVYGEPHIHHRHYLRRPDRKVLRLHEQEEKEFQRDRLGYMKKYWPELVEKGYKVQ